jgi:hypothetical protein
LIRLSSEPIVKNWFFKPRLSIEMWSNEVSRNYHLSGYLSVTRFVWTHQPKLAKPVEKLNVEERTGEEYE